MGMGGMREIRELPGAPIPELVDRSRPQGLGSTRILMTPKLLDPATMKRFGRSRLCRARDNSRKNSRKTLVTKGLQA